MLKKLIICFMGLFLIGTAAYAAEINYTLENDVLMVTGSTDFEGELILPTPEMGEVDEIVIEFGTFSHSGVTDVKLTAKNRIYIGGTESDFPDRDLDGAFERCKQLKTVELDAPTVEIDGYAFIDDTALETVNINCEELTVGESGFYDCDVLENFSCSAVTVSIGSYAFVMRGEHYELSYLPWIMKKNGFVTLGDTLIAYSGTGKAVVIDNEKLAIDVVRVNKNLEYVVLTDRVRGLPTGSWFDSMFWGMENLVSVRLPSGLKVLPLFTFYDCPRLESVELPEKLEYIFDLSFAYCPAMKSLTIPRGTYVLSFGLLNREPFYECENLTLTVYEGSYGEEYAVSSANVLPYTVIPKVNFADESVKRAAQIALASSGEVYEEDLKEVTELSLIGAKTLEDIVMFPNLKSLSAIFGYVSDLSPLENMTELEELNLSFNRISDISPLENLTGLRTLNLMGNMISDDSALDHLTVRPSLAFPITAFNYTDMAPYLDVNSSWTRFRLPQFGGQWSYAIYYDGSLIDAGLLTDNDRGSYYVHYDEVEDMSLLTVKAFLWESYESLRPYDVLGIWNFPVISSEYLK